MESTAIAERSDIAKSWTDEGSRILAIKEQGVRPLIDASPMGLQSPSSSLLIERFSVDQPGRQTHVLTDHVLTLFLKPTAMQHARDGGPVSQLQLDAGQVVICVRDDIEDVSWSSSMDMLCVRIGEEVLGGAARSLTNRNRVEVQSKLQANDPRITSLLYALEAEHAREYPSGRLFLDSVEAAVAALLVTSHSANPSTSSLCKGGLAPHRLRRVLDFMHTNLAEQVGLQDLASCAGMSVSNFSHQFRTSMQVSPYKFMRDLRIERSKQLLKDRNRTVLEVALAVGFESQQHFATIFRRVVGVPPSTYRQRL